MSAKSEPSIAARSRGVRQKLADLISRIESHQHDRAPVEASVTIDALDRFTLWAGNMGAMHPPESKLSLDQRLAEAPEVQELVCQLLDDLQEAVEDLSTIVSGESENREMACNIGFDDESNVQVMLSHDEDTIKGPADEATMILKVISECITSLFRTGILIRKAGPTDRFARALRNSTFTFHPASDVDYVREKHRKLRSPDMRGISERLGNAIAKRRQFIKYSRDHKARLAYEEPRDAPEGHPARTEQLSSKATSLHPERLPAAPLPLTACEEEQEDSVSVISASTLSSSISKLKLPRLEDISPSGAPFECPICFTLQSFRREKYWRVHAFHDLKAYICTIGGRDCESELFGDRNSWFEHEVHHHRSQFVCILCAAGPLASRSALENHITRTHGSFPQEQLGKLSDASWQTSARFRAQDCPFCDEWGRKLHAIEDPKGKMPAESDTGRDVLVSATRFKRHVAVHQEQLAIFAMPRAAQESGTPGSGSIGSLSAVKCLPGTDSVEAADKASWSSLDRPQEWHVAGRRMIHELAVEDQTFEYLESKWKGLPEEFGPTLAKLADFNQETGQWAMSNRYWKEQYESQEVRQQAIDNAVRQYDKTQPQWKKLLPTLLPKEDEIKGSTVPDDDGDGDSEEAITLEESQNDYLGNWKPPSHLIDQSSLSSQAPLNLEAFAFSDGPVYSPQMEIDQSSLSSQAPLNLEAFAFSDGPVYSPQMDNDWYDPIESWINAPPTFQDTMARSLYIQQDPSSPDASVQHAGAPPLVCVFGYAGCTATFSSKDEWKRHALYEHVIPYCWECTDEGCCVRVKSSSKSLVFTRKDIYRIHVHHMHMPEVYIMAGEEHRAEWDRMLRRMLDAAERKRCELPTYMKCPAPGCVAEFRGATVWDDRMDHVALHLDGTIGPGKAQVVLGGDHDHTLTEWAERPDVNIVRRVGAGRWELVVPPRTKAQGGEGGFKALGR